MTMTIPVNKRRQFLQTLGKILSSTDNELIRVSLSKLRGINEITMLELKQALDFAKKADIIRVTDVRLFDSSVFNGLREKEEIEAIRKLGVRHIPDNDNQMRRARIDHFFGGQHTWDTRDKLDIAVNENNLERELRGERIGEIQELLLVDPDPQGMIQIVVNKNYRDSIPVSKKKKTWRLLHEIAAKQTVEYSSKDKTALNSINRPNNALFRKSHLPPRKLVHLEGGNVTPLIPIKRLTLTEFRRRNTRQA